MNRLGNDFVIKWKGYDKLTREPLENMNCNDKIMEYLRKIDADINNEYFS